MGFGNKYQTNFSITRIYFVILTIAAWIHAAEKLKLEEQLDSLEAKIQTSQKTGDWSWTGYGTYNHGQLNEELIKWAGKDTFVAYLKLDPDTCRAITLTKDYGNSYSGKLVLDSTKELFLGEVDSQTVITFTRAEIGERVLFYGSLYDHIKKDGTKDRYLDPAADIDKMSGYLSHIDENYLNYGGFTLSIRAVCRLISLDSGSTGLECTQKHVNQCHDCWSIWLLHDMEDILDRSEESTCANPCEAITQVKQRIYKINEKLTSIKFYSQVKFGEKIYRTQKACFSDTSSPTLSLQWE